MDRDRNDDVFYLQPHYVYDDYEDDRNNTIIDDILDVTDLKAAIDDSLGGISDAEPDNGGEVFPEEVMDGIIFFEEYMKYTFIDCNLRQLDNDFIKERFKTLFNDKGIIPIDANLKPSAEYIKKIDCNEIGGEDNADNT